MVSLVCPVASPDQGALLRGMATDPVTQSFPCFSADDSSYDLQNLKITISPDPPQESQNLTIAVSGTFSKLKFIDIIRILYTE